MRVLLNILSCVSGGAVTWVQNLVPELGRLCEQRDGQHRLVVLAHESQLALIPGRLGIDLVTIRGVRPVGYRRLWWERRHLAGIVGQQRADVLLVPYQVGSPIGGTKLVLMLRNMEPLLFKRYRYGSAASLRNHALRFQTVRSLPLADRVIAVSGFVRDYLVGVLGVHSARVRRIYHGRDLSFSCDGDAQVDGRELAALGVDGEFVFTCGSVLPYRRCEDVIAAFDKCLASRYKEAKLVIAGAGTDRRYRQTIDRAIAEAGCADRILAVGNVPQGAMRALYRRCRLFVTATEIEACPNIAIEAMSSGCPILSGDSPPLPEIFGGCSLVFEARNVDDLARKMCLCWEDEHLRRDLKARALGRAADFSWHECAEATFRAVVDWSE